MSHRLDRSVPTETRAEPALLMAGVASAALGIQMSSSTSDKGGVLLRLRTNQSGFGLVELLISLTILNVGLLALVASLNSGALALRRAGATSTATALADARLEYFRSLLYEPIATDAPGSDSLYTGAAPSGTAVTSGCTGTTEQCDPIRSVTGPDGKAYRLDTYVTLQTPSGGRELKLVRVIVRDGSNLSKELVRAESTFDVSTGA